MSERKTTEFKMRVAESDKTSWQIAAEEEDIGLSEFARRAMNDRARQKPSVGSHPEGEASSVAPNAVSTSTDGKSVAKPWMFEARDS